MGVLRESIAQLMEEMACAKRRGCGCSSDEQLIRVAQRSKINAVIGSQVGEIWPGRQRDAMACLPESNGSRCPSRGSSRLARIRQFFEEACDFLTRYSCQMYLQPQWIKWGETTPIFPMISSQAK